MAAEWFCRVRGAVQGPFTPADVRRLARNGTLAIGDELRQGSTGEWVPAERLKGVRLQKRNANLDDSTFSVASTVQSQDADEFAASCIRESLDSSATSKSYSAGLTIAEMMRLATDLDTKLIVPQESRSRCRFGVLAIASVVAFAAVVPTVWYLASKNGSLRDATVDSPKNAAGDVAHSPPSPGATQLRKSNQDRLIPRALEVHAI